MQPARKIPHCVKLFTTSNKVPRDKCLWRCKNFKFQSRHIPSFVLLLFYWRCNATRTRVCWREEFFLCVLGIPTGATWKIAMTCFFLGKLAWKNSAVRSHCIAYLMICFWSFISFFISVYFRSCFSVSPFIIHPRPYSIIESLLLLLDVGEESRGAACVQLKSCPSTHFVYLRIANCPLPFHDLCRVSFFLKGSGRTALEIRPRSCCASIDLFPPTYFFLNWPFSQSSIKWTRLFRAFKTFWPLRASSVDNHKDDCVEFQK
jgi:hypothetical protein